MHLLNRVLCFSILLATTLGALLAQNVQSVNKGPHLRDLELGELNFLHTTDTHGWYGSHRNQEDYDADWGDFISFVKLFKQNRIYKNHSTKKDLIVIDTGDKHDGNGLSDATSPNGLESTHIFNSLDYDLLTLGNHELYSAERAVLEYHTTAMSKKFKDKYVSSNVEYITQDGKKVPFGNKFVYFETKNTHYRVLTLSFIFNFKKVNERAKVTPLVEEVQKEWFNNLLKQYPSSKIDLILVFGHIPVTDPDEREINLLHECLRSFYPNTTIQYFGGHTHIRDFVAMDNRSTCLQSGRFSETVGFLSINDIASPHKKPRFFRRYLDFNKRSFKFHSHTAKLTTKVGRYVSSRINALREILDLDHQYGVVSQTYYMTARPIESDSNIYQLFKTYILPRLNSTLTDVTINRIVMMNTGAIRYDLYKGPFTKDTEYIVLPFENTWNYIELPLMIATRIEEFLNNFPYVIQSLSPPETHTFKFMAQDRSRDCPTINVPDFSEGFTTTDDFDCEGDDTPHNTKIIYPIPNVIQSTQLVSNEANDPVHFVFFSFLTDDILAAANAIGAELIPHFQNYSKTDIYDYGGQSAKELLREYFVQVPE